MAVLIAHRKQVFAYDLAHINSIAGRGKLEVILTGPQSPRYHIIIFGHADAPEPHPPMQQAPVDCSVVTNHREKVYPGHPRVHSALPRFRAPAHRMKQWRSQSWSDPPKSRAHGCSLYAYCAVAIGMSKTVTVDSHEFKSLINQGSTRIGPAEVEGHDSARTDAMLKPYGNRDQSASSAN